MGLLVPASCSPPKTGCWDTCWGCWWACWIGCLKIPGCLEKFGWTVWNCWLICCCCCCCCRDDGRLPSEGNFLSIKGGERCCWYIPPPLEGLPDLESKDKMNLHPPYNDFTYIRLFLSTFWKKLFTIKNNFLNSFNTVEDRFSGHRFSGKPRFKGHFKKVLTTNFNFQYTSPLEIAENLNLEYKRSLTIFPAKSSLHCSYLIRIGTPKYILQCCGCIRGWISATSPHPSVVVRRGVPVTSPGPDWPRRSAQLVPVAPADVRQVWQLIY